jgi:hypothetical protein
VDEKFTVSENVLVPAIDCVPVVVTIPAPAKVDDPVPPFAKGKVPVTPVVKGRPVALVSVRLVGVPSAPEDSIFVAIAVAMLLNSVSISVPLTTLLASPVVSESLAAKFTVFV